MAKHPKEIYREKRSASDRVALKIADFTGNLSFVWWHVVLFILWIGLNLISQAMAWDPYPFNFLTMIVSLEAIFLSTFVLIAENREAKRNEVREQLDYEVNVKAEKEIQEIKKMITAMQEQLAKKK